MSNSKLSLEPVCPADHRSCLLEFLPLHTLPETSSFNVPFTARALSEACSGRLGQCLNTVLHAGSAVSPRKQNISSDEEAAIIIITPCFQMPGYVSQRTPVSHQGLRKTPSQPAPRPRGSKRTPPSRLVSVNVLEQAHREGRGVGTGNSQVLKKHPHKPLSSAPSPAGSASSSVAFFQNGQGGAECQPLTVHAPGTRTGLGRVLYISC
ncbi:hypothetical protein AAFF_G00255340 [Aldrovandia affinis]|uniref:Uncharacterized protein n=1 Tax=Aldrovandia affinis TaxID=143900 RepID=A0AAD7RCW9_9TELE|nr:hypothetical protein AAFF_G00255340 [Aldrovandia affinis]